MTRTPRGPVERPCGHTPSKRERTLADPRAMGGTAVAHPRLFAPQTAETGSAAARPPVRTFLRPHRRAGQASSLRRLSTTSSLVTALLASGCSLPSVFEPRPDPTRFFVLVATEDPLVAPPAAARPSGRGAPVSVGLGPITLPDYVLRPELVLRTSPTEIRPSAADRWAEPIEKNLARVLADDLRARLPVDRILLYPWYVGDEPSHRVEIEVERLEVAADGHAVLVARWEIRGPGSPFALGSGRVALDRAPAANDPAMRVAALSECVAELARVTAEALLGVLGKP